MIYQIVVETSELYLSVSQCSVFYDNFKECRHNFNLKTGMFDSYQYPSNLFLIKSANKIIHVLDSRKFIILKFLIAWFLYESACLFCYKKKQNNIVKIKHFASLKKRLYRST